MERRINKTDMKEMRVVLENLGYSVNFYPFSSRGINYPQYRKVVLKNENFGVLKLQNMSKLKENPIFRLLEVID